LDDLLERLKKALEGRYEIERQLGSGGTATVYLARDFKHRRRVAIKVMRPDLAAIVGPERFLHEIEITAGLTHPHILTLLDSGEADGLLFYVMPYIEGESLRDRLHREKQLPIEDSLRITREVADALEYAHSQKLIHRDIKPENILLSEGHAVVADFGIARAIEGGQGLTRTGVAIGTPAYMSPEQASGDELDARSDLYSLGCVLYEMLAGEPPFTGPTAESILNQHRTAEAPSVRVTRPGVAEDVERRLRRVLSKTPADRYPTAKDFAGTLEVAIDSSPSVSTRQPRRHWVGWAVGVGAIVALASVLIWAKIITFPISAGEHEEDAPLPLREWIWVADFEGPADDPTLARAARDLVIAALDQSPVVIPVPTSQVQLALEMAGKPDTVRVDAELARELAYRSAVTAVVEGSVQRAGESFTTVLRVAESESGEAIVTVSGVADDEDALISSLSELSRQIGEGLASNSNQLKATRISLGPSPTPVFAAFKKGMQAEDWPSSTALSSCIG
jgi:serine/threonine-protein kinase